MINSSFEFYETDRSWQLRCLSLLTGVRSCYDEGKRTAETLTMDYHRGAGVEVGVIW